MGSLPGGGSGDQGRAGASRASRLPARHRTSPPPPPPALPLPLPAQSEFHSEREEMLGVIRELQRQLKLKQTLIRNFVRPQDAAKVPPPAGSHTWPSALTRAGCAGGGACAVGRGGRLVAAAAAASGREPCTRARARACMRWHAAAVCPRPAPAPQLRPKRPIASRGARRPETEYARQRQRYDPNPRYKVRAPRRWLRSAGGSGAGRAAVRERGGAGAGHAGAKHAGLRGAGHA